MTKVDDSRFLLVIRVYVPILYIHVDCDLQPPTTCLIDDRLLIPINLVIVTAIRIALRNNGQFFFSRLSRASPSMATTLDDFFHIWIKSIIRRRKFNFNYSDEELDRLATINE